MCGEKPSAGRNAPLTWHEMVRRYAQRHEPGRCPTRSPSSGELLTDEDLDDLETWVQGGVLETE